MTNTVPSVARNRTEGGSEAVEDSLNLRGVGKEFGVGKKRYYALENINLTVPRGELLCLLGPSGCGKSTLLNIVAGFMQADSGTVRFGNRDIVEPGPSRVMLFQDSLSALFPWLNAQDNVEFGLSLRGVSTSERRETADQFLTMVGLDAHREKFPHEMSGGMRQRLQIARALVTNPDMLLMDEPFGALDALTRRNMHRALLEVWERTRKTVIFVTHDIAESILLADRIAVMSIGPRSIIRELVDLRHLSRPRDPSAPGFGAAYSEIERLLNADPNMRELS